jgi:hypothetical protein
MHKGPIGTFSSDISLIARALPIGYSPCYHPKARRFGSAGYPPHPPEPLCPLSAIKPEMGQHAACSLLIHSLSCSIIYIITFCNTLISLHPMWATDCLPMRIRSFPLVARLVMTNSPILRMPYHTIANPTGPNCITLPETTRRGREWPESARGSRLRRPCGAVARGDPHGTIRLINVPGIKLT